jgi:hypothetical protein
MYYCFSGREDGPNEPASTLVRISSVRISSRVNCLIAPNFGAPMTSAERQDGRRAAHSLTASMPFDLNSARAEGPDSTAIRAVAASACSVAAPIPAE